MKASAFLRLSDAALRVSRDGDAWMRGLSSALEEARPEATGTITYSYALKDGHVTVEHCHLSGSALHELNVDGLSALSSAQTSRLFGGAVATTAVEAFGGRLPNALAESFSQLGVQDIFGLIANTGDGSGMLVASVEASVVPVDTIRMGQAVANTLRTSLLLRRALSGRPLEDAVDAIFTQDGTAQSVTGAARALPLRALREVVRQREAARKSADGGDYRALDVWSQICAGKYRLVDYIDRNSKRFVVLVAAQDNALRALTPIETRIAELCGRAFSNKLIAFELRSTETAIENHITRVLAKLGLRQRLDLVRLYTDLERAAHRTEDAPALQRAG